MRTNIRWATTGLALAAIVALAGCAPSGAPAGGTPEPSGSGAGAVGNVGGQTGGGTGGGQPAGDGPWPVGIASGQVELGTPGKYCGGQSATMVGTVMVSVANGPVTIKIAWEEAGGAITHAESTLQFTGTGAQVMKVNANWTRKWNSSATVRIVLIDLEPGPGQQAGQYVPPNPHDIDYTVPQCTTPDLDVEILGVQVPPQQCPLGQAIPVARITLNSPLSGETGPITAPLRWTHPLNGTLQSVDLTFEPGGPTVLTLPTVWMLPAPRGFVAKAEVRIPRPGANALRYFAEDVNFVTQCIP